jgi:hypothetical protein
MIFTSSAGWAIRTLTESSARATAKQENVLM